LRRIQELTEAGCNIEGVRRVLLLEAELDAQRRENDRLRRELAETVAATHRQYRRDLVPVTQTLVVVNPRSVQK
jgi:MerR family transcriptional regulator/heat shock protein HspR